MDLLWFWSHSLYIIFLSYLFFIPFLNQFMFGINKAEKGDLTVKMLPVSILPPAGLIADAF